MKTVLTLLLILSASSLFAQITLEHQYRPNAYNLVHEIVTVDSNTQKIIDLRRVLTGDSAHTDPPRDTIIIYNIDHTLDRVIPIPPIPNINGNKVSYITKHLFNLDDNYEYLVWGGKLNSFVPYVKVFDESGTEIFSCDSCLPNHENLSSGAFILEMNASFIVNTSNGPKLTIQNFATGKLEVYSLPGKFPNCCYSTANLSVTDAPSIITSGNSFPTFAYPNPTNGKVRVEYKLPIGVTSGEIVITSSGGNEVKRYRVTDTFNDILIEQTDLASGSYFYRLVTEKGESEAKRLVVTR